MISPPKLMLWVLIRSASQRHFNEYPQHKILGGWVWQKCGVSYVTGGVQPKLVYCWARPLSFVAGKGRGGMFLFLLFLHFHFCSSFFPVPLFHFYYLFSHFLLETTQNNPQGDVSLNPNTINMEKLEKY